MIWAAERRKVACRVDAVPTKTTRVTLSPSNWRRWGCLSSEHAIRYVTIRYRQLAKRRTERQACSSQSDSAILTVYCLLFFIRLGRRSPDLANQNESFRHLDTCPRLRSKGNSAHGYCPISTTQSHFPARTNHVAYPRSRHARDLSKVSHNGIFKRERTPFCCGHALDELIPLPPRHSSVPIPANRPLFAARN